MNFNTLPLLGWTIQSADPAKRVSLVANRTGGKALCLSTEPGDIDVAYSGLMERCDAYMSHPGTVDPFGFLGCELEIYHSLFLPRDRFRLPIGESYVLADLHGWRKDASAANFMVNFVNWNSPMQDKLGWLQIQLFHGNPVSPTEYAVALCVPTFDTWYDFHHQVRLSSGQDGYFRSSLNGVPVLSYRGPTTFAADFVYFKLANYHAIRTDIPSVPCSVIHDSVQVRVRCPSPEWL